VAERIYAFAPYAADRATAWKPTAGAGVAIALRRPVAMLDVRGPADAVAAHVKARHGLDISRQPNTAIGFAVRALWLGPDEWLIVSNATASAISDGCDRTDVSITDVSHGRAALRMRGPHVRDALAKGCPLDLDSRVFPPGRCAQTAIGRISVILDHVERDVFDVYCSRSYAASFWHWLTRACAEYGCAVAPPE
jgi:sarcosine oxidase subunit gamma